MQLYNSLIYYIILFIYYKKQSHLIKTNKSDLL